MAKKSKQTTESATAAEVSTPTDISLTIQGLIFSTPLRYSEGHVVNAVEAHTLNQTLGENLRNNFAKTVANAKTKAEAEVTAGTRTDAALNSDEIAELGTAFADYAVSYVFQGVRRSNAAPADPVGREAHKLAKQVLDEMLRKKSIDKKTLAEGKYDELLLAVQAKRPDIREEAERRVAAAKSAAEADISDLLGDTTQAAAA